jgi:hypothetical protein
MTSFAHSSNINGTAVADWLYACSGLQAAESLLERPDIEGAQVQYTWKSLEPQEGKYNFSSIDQDLALVQSKGKQLWVQLQDRSFNLSEDFVPDYLHEPIYNNGSVVQCNGVCDTFIPGGWVAVQWNKHVRSRFQLLLQNLATHFDGQIYGINLPESAITVQQSENNFSCKGYFDGEMDNVQYTREVFQKSYVVQYINFWPCGYGGTGGYLADSFAFAANHSIGIGGPDDIPFHPAQEHNSYPYMYEYRNKVPISVIAVQQGDLTAINPKTNETFTKADFTSFAINNLGVSIIFWATSSPWLLQ